MHSFRLSCIVLGALLIGSGILTGCQSVARYKTSPESAPRTSSPATTTYSYQEGYASYYAEEFNGRPTSSGEIYNMNAMTAAHPSLPLGTTVRVTNLENQKQVQLKINDRMPKNAKGRIIDLSLAAAKSLDMIRSGIVRVRVEVTP
jgi:rare lipoprotein A